MDDPDDEEHNAQDGTINTSKMELRPELQYAEIMVKIHYPQYKFNGHAKVVNCKLIVAVIGGIVIFPEDMSYKQFISNTWYE